MSLKVRLELGDHPQIHVTGTIVEKLRREQLSDLLRGEGDLMDKVRNLHHGARPDGIHLSDEDGVPHNLAGTMSKYGWNPGRVVVHPGKARVNEATSNPVAIGSALVHNDDDDSNLIAAYQIDETVTNTVGHSSDWNITAGFSQSITYEVGGEAVGGKVGGSTTFSVSTSYGESSSHTKEISSGSHGSGTVELEPGERSFVVLSATRGAVEADVEYVHAIDGGVFYHFGKRIDGHYLWYARFSDLYNPRELHRTRREKLSIDVYSDWDIGLEPGEV